MLYDIKGFRYEDGVWSPVPVDDETVEPHYKQECRRLGIYGRADLDRLNVAPSTSEVDVSAGESVSIALRYYRRSTDDEGSLVESIATDVATTIVVEIEDPGGETSTVEFDPVNGEASFSLTPDVVGTWTVRSVTQTDEFVDEYATVEAI